MKIDGKPDAYGVQTISAYGAFFTDVSWNPAREGEKTTGVYAKQ